MNSPAFILTVTNDSRKSSGIAGEHIFSILIGLGHSMHDHQKLQPHEKRISNCQAFELREQPLD